MLSIKRQGIDVVDLAAIRSASQRIALLVKRTPVMTSRLFDEACGYQCFLKCENLQRGGSFKMRGAANFLLSIPPADLPNGVVAFSSGNHAQAVALAAAHTGTSATIAMPLDAPAAKLAATKAYGAQVVPYDRFRDDREAIGRKIASETGATLVPPYDHEWIIAGQGTAALELLEEVPDLDVIVACVGGGGLLSGTATAALGIRPAIKVYGAEPELANDTYLSLRAGERVEIAPPDTIADGLRPTKPGAVTFPIVHKLVDDILLVSEEEILQTQSFVASRMKLVVEPSGAVSAAVALFRKLPLGVSRVGCVFSGGNV
ncbi:MAG: pyridoxal-phosphate dependent enzyme [Bryobacteraceae bacterium]|nr:pyridoxal-phosphate dependent enzyme [Bryobacteraceae bacterium]